MAESFGDVPIGTSVPAVRGYFGATGAGGCRLQYFQTALTARQVRGILGHDPRSRKWKTLGDPELREMYEYLQRATEPDRALGLEEYIKTRLRPNPVIPGAFPAISIGLLDAISWKPSGGEESIAGVVTIPVESRRILLDGLGRLTAVLNLLEQEEKARPAVPRDSSLNKWFTFPVTLYTPAPGATLTLEDLGQLFFDFNYRQKQVKKSKAMTVDKSDLHIRLTNELGERPDGIISQNGGMYRKSASLGGNAKELVSQQHLLKFVRGACEGRKAQDSDKALIQHPNLTLDTFGQLHEQLEDFLTSLATRMDDRFADKESLHLSSIGWQVLGLVFHAMYFELKDDLTDTDRSVIVDRLASMDWTKYNLDLIQIMGEGVPEPSTGRLKLAKFTKLGRETKNGFLGYVQQQCGLAPYLAEAAQEEQPVG